MQLLGRRRGGPILSAGVILVLVVAGCAGEEPPGTQDPDDTSVESPTPGTPEPEDTETGDPEADDTDPDDTDGDDAQAEEDDSPLAQQGVSAAHPEAVDVGEAILSEGGNAVDAAVAVAFAVSVVEPFASGIGGGGATILAGPDLDPVNYDYREQVAVDGQIPESGTGVPGFAAGMGELHEDHGTLEWESLLEPARALAAEGFETSEFLQLRMREDFGPAAVEDLEQFTEDGDPLSAGDTLVQTELADTIEALARRGPEDLYTGELSDELTQIDGLDAQTLQDYEVVVGEPVTGPMGDFELVSAAPALPGAAVIELMQRAEDSGVAQAEPGSAEHLITLAEAWEDALETAETQLGDPRFTDVPLQEIIDAEPAGASDAHTPGTDHDVPVHPAASEPLRGFGGPEQATTLAPGSTTHVTVVDQEGLMVSMTNTITSFWGSGDSVGGFFLNNQLSRFDAVDSSANQPEPGRRSVSWSAPTMVLDDLRRPVLGIGTPGGPQIPTILAEVLTRWGLQGQSLEQAVQTPRAHLDGDQMLIEAQLDDATLAALQDQGWEVVLTPVEQAVFGSVQALEVDYDDGSVSGVDDTRREGAHRIVD